MYIQIGNTSTYVCTVHTNTYVCTLIKRKSTLFHNQIRMYMHTNKILPNIICTVQVLALIGNLCQQPGMMPT